MRRLFRNVFKSQRERRRPELEPPEVLLDAQNLPSFDQHQLEGRFEKPIGHRTFVLTGMAFLLTLVISVWRVWTLQVQDGQTYARRAAENHLRHTPIFADRGHLFDGRGVLLAENRASPEHPEFSERRYADIPGIAHVLGYLRYPSKDKAGFYYQEDLEGLEGVEQFFDETLGGRHGLRIVETTALQEVISESVIEPPRAGENLTLSIDTRLSAKLYELLKERATEVSGFTGGAAVLMDVLSGEILALTNYPEYNPNILTDGTDVARINGYLTSENKPFLNRSADGLYTPGSIIKPFIALAALTENIIDPEKKIISTGSISIPHPYDPTKRSVFTDWKAHGPVDMRDAIAVSSNVYFYHIGGGFEGQAGLGIGRIEQYMRLFGFGDPPSPSFPSFTDGVIPSPEWKHETFGGDPWRLGDTYNTSIGQYGFQVTPVQVVRAVAAIANGGRLIEPTILKLQKGEERPEITLPIPAEAFTVVREGMRQSVLRGTAQALFLQTVSAAAKTGTAEVGPAKRFINSWVIGFFPYESPRVAFAVILERAPRGTTTGAPYLMRQFLEWLSRTAPEYARHAEDR